MIPGSRRSPGEGNGNPLQYSCLENPKDGGAWWATVHRVTKSRTRPSDFTFTMFGPPASVSTLPPFCPPHQSPGPLPAQSSPFHPAPQSTGTSQCLQPHPGGPAGWGLGGGHWTHHLKSPPAPTDLSGVPRRAAPQPIWSLL